jgi:transcription elongation factor Elf1
MAEESPTRDIRFCPYCCQQQFDVSTLEGGTVYCEVCGIEVEVKELMK